MAEVKAASDGEIVPVTTQQEAVVESAIASVDDERARITDLEARLTREGRSKKQIESALSNAKDQLKTKEDALSKAQTDLSQWEQWYMEHAATPEQRAAYNNARKQREMTQNVNASQREAMWKEVAQEDSPDVKSALLQAIQDTEDSFLSPAAIRAIRKALGSKVSVKADSEDTVAEPPKVSGSRSTGGKEPSLDEQLKTAYKEKNFALAIELKARKAAMEQTLRRG